MRRVSQEKVRPFGVYTWHLVPFDESFHRESTLRHVCVSGLSVRLALPGRSRSLFCTFSCIFRRGFYRSMQLLGSAANKPEHSPTVLSELNIIGLGVARATKTLHKKISSITNNYRPTDFSLDGESSLLMNGSFYHFPWHL